MDVAERVSHVRERIAQAAERAGRSPDEMRILAATKGRSVAEILAAVEAGIELIGENTIQEALSKFEFLPPKLERHMIGTLQINKAKTAVRLFDMIESVNSFELAQEIERHAQHLEPYPVLVEVNPAGEETKRGVALEEVKGLFARLNALEHIHVRGLMAMMPYTENPEEVRPCFQQMKTLFDELNEGSGRMTILSMGMSHDYEIAVEEGATLLRLGTCLFGPRRSR